MQKFRLNEKQDLILTYVLLNATSLGLFLLSFMLDGILVQSLLRFIGIAGLAILAKGFTSVWKEVLQYSRVRK